MLPDNIIRERRVGLLPLWFQSNWIPSYKSRMQVLAIVQQYIDRKNLKRLLPMGGGRGLERGMRKSP